MQRPLCYQKFLRLYQSGGWGIPAPRDPPLPRPTPTPARSRATGGWSRHGETGSNRQDNRQETPGLLEKASDLASLSVVPALSAQKIRRQIADRLLRGISRADIGLAGPSTLVLGALQDRREL